MYMHSATNFSIEVIVDSRVGFQSNAVLHGALTNTSVWHLGNITALAKTKRVKQHSGKWKGINKEREEEMDQRCISRRVHRNTWEYLVGQVNYDSVWLQLWLW